MCAVAGAGLSCAIAGTARADLNGFADFAPVNNNAAGAGSYDASRSTFTLTTGVGSQASSGFASTPQNISSFNAFYTFTNTNGADGTMFVLQNDARGVTALGDGGGALGYGGANAAFPAITSSVAQALSIYNVSNEQLATNGVLGAYNPTAPLSTRGVTTGVFLSYNGSNLKVTLANGSLYTRTYANVNIPGTVGGSTARVGFTGATGGATATQSVSNFAFRSAPATLAPIAVTGYTHDMIVERTAPTTGSTVVNAAVTATLDGGTAKNGNTYYEQGYNPNNAAVGVPLAGSTLASTSDYFHQFRMAPSYAANNAVLVDSANQFSTLDLTTPARYGALSLLTAAGAGAVNFLVIVGHTTGPDEIITGVVSPDWYNNAPVALAVGSRVSDGSTGPAFDTATVNPRLYQIDLPLSDTTNPISSLTFSYTSGAGHAAIFALSGAPVPEPTATGVLALAATGLLSGRRRRCA